METSGGRDPFIHYQAIGLDVIAWEYEVLETTGIAIRAGAGAEIGDTGLDK